MSERKPHQHAPTGPRRTTILWGLLAQSESRDEAERMLASYVMTHPGREDDVALHTLSANGKTIVCEDIFDIGFPR
jgi:hypothetical protein